VQGHLTDAELFDKVGVSTGDIYGRAANLPFVLNPLLTVAIAAPRRTGVVRAGWDLFRVPLACGVPHSVLEGIPRLGRQGRFPSPHWANRVYPAR